MASFNTQPPEGGCEDLDQECARLWVSTHSRPKAAAAGIVNVKTPLNVSTHSRPKAAAQYSVKRDRFSQSFNTQPPEGGCHPKIIFYFLQYLFQHTAARRRLPWLLQPVISITAKFQHTAARRRLRNNNAKFSGLNSCFNTQPPEGGCLSDLSAKITSRRFQHTAARRRLPSHRRVFNERKERFQHTAARRRLQIICHEVTLNE